MGQTKDRGELNPCPRTAQGNGLFHRAGRGGEHLLPPAAKGLWTEATQILQESTGSWIWLHPWDWKRHTNCRGYKLCLAARAPAFPQPGQKVPRASRDAWPHPTEGRHSRKGPRCLLMAAPQACTSVLPSAWSHLTSVPWQLWLHLHGKEAQHPPLVLDQSQSQRSFHFALTWGVKLTLAPRFSSNWATLRFS